MAKSKPLSGRTFAGKGPVIIKLGSSVVVPKGPRPDPRRLGHIARAVDRLLDAKSSVIVVSSGAIAVGAPMLGFKSRPQNMASLQAAAAAGQSALIQAWSRAFEKLDRPVAQVLLTHADLSNPGRRLNLSRSLNELTRCGAVPILNENDSVQYDEIAFGDNDQLAALLCPVVRARAFLMVSVSGGLLSPDGERLRQTHKSPRSYAGWVRNVESALGSGGMDSKLKAAEHATRNGIPTAIIPYGSNTITATLQGADVGTVFLPAPTSPRSRSRGTKPRAHIPSAHIRVHTSLQQRLARGPTHIQTKDVLDVAGTFLEGARVALVNPQGELMGEGVCRYSAEQLDRIQGASSRSIARILGFTFGPVVIHRDDLRLGP